MNDHAKGRIKTKNISMRVLRLNLITVVIAVCLVAVTAIVSASKIITSIAQEESIDAVSIMEQEISNLKTTLETAAHTIANNQTIQNSITENNRAELEKSVTDLSESLNVELALITDGKGVVIASSQDQKSNGMDLSSMPEVKNAIAGKTSSEVANNINSEYAVSVSAPILGEGKTLGTVYVEYKLNNTDFVDALKTMAGNDFTIFAGDTRINTTLIKDGKRAIGTKIDPKVAEIVMNQKQQYTKIIKIFGENFASTYRPILSEDKSTVTGVMFSGRDMSDIEQNKNSIILLLVGMTAAIILVNAVISRRFMKSSLRLPLENIVNAAEELSQGKTEVHLEAHKNNEIGKLAKAFDKMVKGIQEQVSVLQKLADGDLTVQVNLRSDLDTMNIAMQKTIDQLKNMFREIDLSAEQVSDGANQVSIGAQQLSQGATEQASSIQELSATIMEISEKIQRNADNIALARGYAEQAGDNVSQSCLQMQDMLAAMNKINDSSNEISKIIKVIDDIAFQTNILALNAAVEAARAGVAGKGFSVVADEVRKLASKSTEAAKQTSSLIQNSISIVNDGSKIAEKTAAYLAEVNAKANLVTETMDKINQDSQAQATAISQINLGIEQISNVVQTNSATAEESSTASEKLSGQAMLLRDQISYFNTK